jgi:hypothetical protein
MAGAASKVPVKTEQKAPERATALQARRLLESLPRSQRKPQNGKSY